MIRRILVALDASERAPAVLDRAVELAAAHGATLRVFHALAIRQHFPAAAHGAADQLPARLHTLTEARLAGLTTGAHVPAAEVVIKESHHPADAILAESSAYDADLIVIGSHGYRGVDRLLGTTTTKVLHGAARDVFVVHPT